MSKKKSPPTLDLAQLAVKVQGAAIAPTFDAEFGLYEYNLPGGARIAVNGKGRTPEEIRASATKAIEQSLARKQPRTEAKRNLKLFPDDENGDVLWRMQPRTRRNALAGPSASRDVANPQEHHRV